MHLDQWTVELKDCRSWAKYQNVTIPQAERIRARGCVWNRLYVCLSLKRLVLLLDPAAQNKRPHTTLQTRDHFYEPLSGVAALPIQDPSTGPFVAVRPFHPFRPKLGGLGGIPEAGEAAFAAPSSPDSMSA